MCLYSCSITAAVKGVVQSPRLGVSDHARPGPVQYCLLRKSGSDAGATIQTFTFDVKGDTSTQSDHYVDVGRSKTALSAIL